MLDLTVTYKIKIPWSRVQPHSQGFSLRRKRKEEEEEEEVFVEDLVGEWHGGCTGLKYLAVN